MACTKSLQQNSLLPLRLLCALLVLPFACAPGSSEQPRLVYTLSRKPFHISVDAHGVLESRKATTLTAPVLGSWRKLEITYLAPEGSAVKKGDVVVIFDSTPFESAYRNALNKLAIAHADANKKQAERLAQQFILEADRQTATAAAAVSRLQLAKLQFVSPRLREIKKLELKRDGLQAEKIRKRLASIAAIQESERTQTHILIRQAERELKAAEETINKLSVRASTEGIVIYDRGWHAVKPREGSAKYPGETVARIPDLSTMQVKLHVGEIQSQGLMEGQNAEITVTTLSAEPVTGKVARVARRAVPWKTGSNVKQVEVIVELDSTRIGYTTGLSARVRISLTDGTMALAVPLDCVFERDSLHMVYVRHGDKFVSRRVNLTARNSDFAIVEGDLEAGTELAMGPPPP